MKKQEQMQQIEFYSVYYMVLKNLKLQVTVIGKMKGKMKYLIKKILKIMKKLKNIVKN